MVKNEARALGISVDLRSAGLTGPYMRSPVCTIDASSVIARDHLDWLPQTQLPVFPGIAPQRFARNCSDGVWRRTAFEQSSIPPLLSSAATTTTKEQSISLWSSARRRAWPTEAKQKVW